MMAYPSGTPDIIGRYLGADARGGRLDQKGAPWQTSERSSTRPTRTRTSGSWLRHRSSALQGVSESDAAHLKEAFGIDTIRELATNKFVLWAQAINVLAK